MSPLVKYITTINSRKKNPTGILNQSDKEDKILFPFKTRKECAYSKM